MSGISGGNLISGTSMRGGRWFVRIMKAEFMTLWRLLYALNLSRRMKKSCLMLAELIALLHN